MLELARLRRLRLPARTGNVEEVAAGIAALRAEAAAPRRSAEPGAHPTLRPRIVGEAVQLRSAFGAAPDKARAALRALLGERRMQVTEDRQ